MLEKHSESFYLRKDHKYDDWHEKNFTTSNES